MCWLIEIPLQCLSHQTLNSIIVSWSPNTTPNLCRLVLSRLGSMTRHTGRASRGIVLRWGSNSVGHSSIQASLEEENFALISRSWFEHSLNSTTSPLLDVTLLRRHTRTWGCHLPVELNPTNQTLPTPPERSLLNMDSVRRLRKMSLLFFLDQTRLTQKSWRSLEDSNWNFRGLLTFWRCSIASLTFTYQGTSKRMWSNVSSDRSLTHDAIVSMFRTSVSDEMCARWRRLINDPNAIFRFFFGAGLTVNSKRERSTSFETMPSAASLEIWGRNWIVPEYLSERVSYRKWKGFQRERGPYISPR